MNDDIDILLEQSKEIRYLKTQLEYKDRLINRLEEKIEILKDLMKNVKVQ